MNRSVEIVYQNGVLRPLGPVPLRENERVTIIIPPAPGDEAELLDTEFVEGCRAEEGTDVNLEAVRKSLSKIPGSLTPDFIAEREDR